MPSEDVRGPSERCSWESETGHVSTGREDGGCPCAATMTCHRGPRPGSREGCIITRSHPQRENFQSHRRITREPEQSPAHWATFNRVHDDGKRSVATDQREGLSARTIPTPHPCLEGNEVQGQEERKSSLAFFLIMI